MSYGINPLMESKSVRVYIKNYSLLRTYIINSRQKMSYYIEFSDSSQLHVRKKIIKNRNDVQSNSLTPI